MSQEKFGFIRELTLPELWQLSYAIQERIRTLSMAPSQVWHIEIQQTGGYQPGLDQVVPPCPKWYLGNGILLTDLDQEALERTNPRRELVVCLWSPPWLTPPGVRYCKKTGANQLCC